MASFRIGTTAPAQSVRNSIIPAQMTLRALALASMVAGASVARAQDSNRVLDCESTFPPQLTVAAIENTYGTHQLGTGQIHTGEGRFDEVTILFPGSPADRVEIVWKDNERKREPAQVWIRGEQSRWRTPTGLTVGLDLQSVERLNRRPFLLAGFGFDYAGTETSWQDGRLAAPEGSACGVRAVFAEPPNRAPHSRQVQGSGRGKFSSGHPAMQALNPRIEAIWLAYR